MRAEILAVGTELLLGRIANTDAQYLSRQLSALGIDVFHHVTVGDNPGRLGEALAQALSRADIVITSGGIGPTMDDLTKETAAAHFGRSMYLHEESLRRIEERFRTQGRPMVDSNRKQAMMPRGAVVLPNDRGTAPGCIIQEGDKAVIILPGPPRELQFMFETYVLPWLRQRSGDVMASRWLKVAGYGESHVEALLGDFLQAQSNPTLALYASPGVVLVRLTAKCPRGEDPQALLTPLADAVRGRLGRAVFGEAGETLEGVVARELRARGQTLAVAESCTGGLIASRLVDVPGVSDVLIEGVVTYANSSKVNRLGVSQATLDRYGAVSPQTAEEMAQGVRQRAGASVGLSVTGIAGPGGGTPEKPVGLVYVAIADDQGVALREMRLMGERGHIRHMAALNAMDFLRLRILGK